MTKRNFCTSKRSLNLDEFTEIAVSPINYVKHTLSALVLDGVDVLKQFASDAYIILIKPQSILVTPILNQGKLIGIVYLENRLTAGVFTTDRLEIIKLLCSQAAISLENARLYQESQENAQQLKKSLTELKSIQLQLIQSEKMSALGNLVSGVAHEINNPVGYIAGNIQPASEGIQDLFSLIYLYQQKFPQPGREIELKTKKIDLEYLSEDLPKLINSMQEGVDRICSISTSLRTFSRADTENKVAFNIHDGLDSTILILKHRLKANDTRPAIEIVKNYSDLPLISCFPGQLNQVFMNLLANAIDALEESNSDRSYDWIVENPNRITVSTELDSDRSKVIIRIRDNGIGMSPEVQQRIFEHLYTTKPVGKGTGLGLAIAYQIVVEKHGGKLRVDSAPGVGTEFAIAIPVDLLVRVPWLSNCNPHGSTQ